MRRIFLFTALAAALAGCSTVSNETAPVYIVFFHPGAAIIAPEAVSAIDQAATAIRRAQPGSVAIASGVAVGDNLRLAGPRFDAVRQALVARGVNASLIVRSALPDAKLNAGTAGDTRVEILLLAKPSS
jgi:hypothetical protein